MQRRLRIAAVLGTRPEAVKMSPVIRELRKFPGDFQTDVVVTAQHRAMLDQVLAGFSIVPDYDLDIMRHGQTLVEITHRVLERLLPLLKEISPDLILVQGDTTTVFAASLAAFYAYADGKEVAVGHVEAGLRTENKYNPYPEEMNRRLTTCLTDIHFAPTPQAKENLLRYGVPPTSIYVTGNTVIDALLYAAQHQRMGHKIPYPQLPDHRIVLVTAHRRENWGDPLRAICRAVGALARDFADVAVIFSMHKNPVVREVVQKELGNNERIFLIEPPDYFDFVALMRDSYLILTDSGGVQEEAPSLGKPVLVMRTTTERPEGIAAKTAKLVGTNESDIVREAGQLLASQTAYRRMAQAVNPYGDGLAAARIVRAVRHYFGITSERPEDFQQAYRDGRHTRISLASERCRKHA